MRREKLFGLGRCVPVDRNQKIRIMHLARCLARQKAIGPQRGVITRAALDVLGALLWGFHNAASGRCYPSLARIAEAAGCARSTVQEAIKALESAAILTWHNRLVRRREWSAELGAVVVRAWLGARIAR
jgi:hypothetical protein